MEIVKKYYRWFLVALICIGALGFHRLYVKVSFDDIALENQRIRDKFNTFTKLYEQPDDGLLQTPTQSDLRVGSEFVNAIIRERSAVIMLLKRYALYLDRDIVGDEVVYPAGLPNAGAPVEEMTFADFLQERFLGAMAEVENALFDEEKPIWRSVVLQNIYATTPSITDVKDITGAAHQSGDRMAAGQSRIMTPAKFLPFRMDENFRGQSNREKRWLAWRQYLIFRDLLTRVIAKSKVRVRHDVVGFERASADTDIFENPPTAIIPGRTVRFVQSIDNLQIELVSVGNVQIPEPEIVPDNQPELLRERRAAIAKFRTNDKVPYDLYRVTLQITAHLGVIDQIHKEIVNSSDLLYTPISIEITGNSDSQTMGGFSLPSGIVPNPAQPTAEFLNSAAAVPGMRADYSYEPPVSAKLVYWLHRPCFVNSANPTRVFNFAAGSSFNTGWPRR